MNDPAFCSNTRKPADGPLDDDDAGPVVLLADGGGGGGCCCVVGLLLVTTTFATGVCFVSLCCSLPLATLSLIYFLFDQTRYYTLVTSFAPCFRLDIGCLLNNKRHIFERDKKIVITYLVTTLNLDLHWLSGIVMLAIDPILEWLDRSLLLLLCLIAAWLFLNWVFLCRQMRRFHAADRIKALL